jgi:hypothetical protein
MVTKEQYMFKVVPLLPSIRHEAELAPQPNWAVDVRFSNRPFEVKRFRLTTTALSMSLAGSRFSTEAQVRFAPGAEIARCHTCVKPDISVVGLDRSPKI